MLTEYAFTNKYNLIKLQLQDDSQNPGTLANTDLTIAEKITITFDDDASTSYNTVDDPTILTNDNDGTVTIDLGNSSISAGSYIVYLTVKWVGITNPQRWIPDFRIRID